MRKTLAMTWDAIQKFLGFFVRGINAADAVMETFEAMATGYRDEELARIKKEAAERTEA